MARGETAGEKPSFREAIKRRRALMPADLFYEWQPIEGKKDTVPWCVRKTNDEPFFMGALWEQWTAPDNPNGVPLLTCCVITTDANESLRPIQDRMPLLIDAEHCARWLNPNTPPDVIQSVMVPRASNDLYSYRVSSWVNSPSHDDARCIAPLGDAEYTPAVSPREEIRQKRAAEKLDQFDVFG